jgi:hypothetical protein
MNVSIYAQVEIVLPPLLTRARTLVAHTKRSIGSYTSQPARGGKLYSWFSLAAHARTVCSLKEELVIGLDGSQHLDQEEYDEERTKFLESLGYKTIRFWNNDVLYKIEEVILTIMQVLDKR